MLRSFLLAGLAAASAVALAAPAQAADKRMVTFDSASSEARRLTGAGLTFVFTRQYFRTNILAVRATAVPVGVVPKASHDGAVNRQLDALMGPDGGKGELYEIDPEKAEGKVMIAAFCPGSTKGWLAVGPVYTRKPLRVHAFGDDGQGGVKLCAAMDFTWRGEWMMPKPKGGNTRAAVTKPTYGRPDGS
ncbi:MAG: hypothetical protein K0R83_395 [Caulobacter sp.]|jgi:hypothetical protein|nr:hypothetical protein [Caulobacter sp.]